MLTRWLMVGLAISVGVLLLAAGAGARYIWRRRHRLIEDATEPEETRKGEE